MSKRKQSDDFMVAYASMIGQIGCITSLASIVIIAIAFGAGRLLDRFLGTDGIFTVLFLVGSFPVTLYVIVRLSLSTVARAERLAAQQKEDEDAQEEEIDR